jgi:thiamine-monophosphate kinase
MADISDGLVGDLGHILKASRVGAEIDTLAAAALMQTGPLWSCPEDLALTCVLSGGDDYELVFSASPSATDQVRMASEASGTPVTRIGRITDSQRLVLLGVDGRPVNLSLQSFDHFA